MTEPLCRQFWCGLKLSIARRCGYLLNSCIALVLTMGALILPNIAYAGDVSEDIQSAKRTLAAAFRPLRLVPILVPEDQRPGDVYQLLTWTLKSRRDECFSNLPSDGPAPSRLLDSTSVKDISGSLAFGITKWISAGTNEALHDVVVLKFFDEQSFILSQKALGNHLIANCPELVPIVNEGTIPVASPADLRNKAPLLAILGRVIYAKRRIFIGVTSSVDLNATVSSINSLLSSNKALSILPIDASASVKLGVGNERGVVIEDTSALPVAFSPAFLPDIILSTELGGEAKPTAVAWKALTPRIAVQSELTTSFRGAGSGDWYFFRRSLYPGPRLIAGAALKPWRRTLASAHPTSSGVFWVVRTA